MSDFFEKPKTGLTVLKLSTGEELIVEVLERKTSKDYPGVEILCKNPTRLIMQANQQGQPSLIPIPWMPYCDGPFSVKSDHIVAEVAPTSQLKQIYNEMYSNIVVAPASALSGLSQSNQKDKVQPGKLRLSE